MDERLRRRGAPNNNKQELLKNLELLKQSKEGKVQRVKQYQTAEPVSIYDEVNEEEYRKILKYRQDDEFVIDDDGVGYANYEEEDWDQQHYASDEEEKEKKKKRKSTTTSNQKAKMIKPAQRVDRSFTRLHRNTMSRENNSVAKVSNNESEQLLSSLLDELDNEVELDQIEVASPSVAPTITNSLENVRKLKDIALFGTTSEAQNCYQHSKLLLQQESQKHFQDKECLNSQSSRLSTQITEYSESLSLGDTLINEESPILEYQTTEESHHASIKGKVPLASSPLTEMSPQVEPDLKMPDSNKTNWVELQKSITVKQETKPLPICTLDSLSNRNSNDPFLEENGTLRMFWIDIFEKNGALYLMGKVFNKHSNKHVSCCIVVKGLKRNIFLLPREKRIHASSKKETDVEVSLRDVYDEFNDIRCRYGIAKWASKHVERNYSFEIPGIPAKAIYLKAVYSFEDPVLPRDLTGETFSHAFGTHQTATELFLIKRNLMGPCWIEIPNAQRATTPVSWCKYEVVCNSPKTITPLPEGTLDTPPLNIMCVNMKTVMNHHKHVNEIVVLNTTMYHDVPLETSDPSKVKVSHHTAIRKLPDMVLPAGFQEALKQDRMEVKVETSERVVLTQLTALLTLEDPDIIVGHNFLGFDLDVLLHRMKAHNVEYWSRLGRLRRTQWPKLQAGAGGAGDSTREEKMILSGRLVCDTYLSAKDLIRSESYGLTKLSKTQLQIQREDILPDKTVHYFSNAKDLIHLIRHCQFDSYLVASLMFKLLVLPLTKQLTNLAGNTWARTLIGGRAERNEFLLLHEFHKRKYICPDKEFKGKPTEDGAQPKSSQRKPAYAGGLVLEPKKGLYDKYVLLLDFNSLYPSIIQEYNICFTTVQRDPTSEEIPEVPESTQKGVLPSLLATLVERRRQVKSLMKDPKATPEQLMQYDIRQKALKLTANSMYGCLGFTLSRFYAKPLAMLITSKGREILQNTVDLAEKENYEVIYGDTDSIMVHTHSDQMQEARKIGYHIKKLVNERYKLLEIDIDGFFQRLLLLKKKKYAALIAQEKDGKVITSLETKGLDIVRRDWCALSHDVSSFILEKLFSGESQDDVIQHIHSYLTQIAEEVRGGKISIEKFVINKGLTKAPESYADANIQPHVQVALRMKKRNLIPRIGDTIPFVICTANEEGVLDPNASYATRAFHPDEVDSSKTTRRHIDFEWYLNQQVLPPVLRLCQPIQGMEPGQLSECLGLETKFYSSTNQGGFNEDDYGPLDSQLSDEERFKDVEKWQPKCNHCGEANEFFGIVREKEAHPSPGIECPHCSKHYSPCSLYFQLTLSIRRYITQYYDSWLHCDECGNETRQMSVYGTKCLAFPCQGTMSFKYSDSLLYKQLLYFQSLFDVSKYIHQISKSKNDSTYKNERISMAQGFESFYKPLHELVMQQLEQSGRRYVDLSQLFSFCKV